MTATVSKPVQANAATDNSAENGNGANTNNFEFQDVGLIFVREYYTFLNKSPYRLHGFYKNDSHMVRGEEGVPAETYHGQAAIQKRIEELGFEDCKVIVTQVDSQISVNNGILVQVLGEMCNNGGPLRHFSQTFFLATQETGFYVLNDIFRFLKDEDGIQLEEETDQAPPPAPAPAATATAAAAAPPPPAPVPAPVQAQAQAPATAANVAPPAAPSDTASEMAELDSTAATTASTPVVEPASLEENQTPREDEKKDQKKRRGSAASPAGAKAKPSKPSAPKTWANLAANHESKTPSAGNAPSSPASGAAASTTSASAPTPPAQHNKPRSPPPSRSHGPVRKENMTEIFIKNVSKVTQEQLKEVFAAEFGEVKSVNLVQAKNCAFLEFVSPESCQKALAQNKVQVGEVTVSAEERRPPGSRYPRQQNGFDRKFQSNRRGGGSMRGKPRNPPNPPK
ncbi:hypothetical protein BCR43DRAFT_493168 [Syncephalastrum racemosum]|uniref:NTF2 domain-containing protein n=1 Tax=Syncephalastrum racemosum TaxID=13706 RepID=A0A1X2HA64_SYNRA|nr:hypothetical protein BCR43DRAFT_493168 [Syncephalastrum racemosum]